MGQGQPSAGDLLHSRIINATYIAQDNDYWRDKGDYNALLQNARVRQLVLDDLARVGKENKVHGFEVLKGLHLEKDPFTESNNLMTPTHKLRRNELRKKFQPTLENLYQEIHE